MVTKRTFWVTIGSVVATFVVAIAVSWVIAVHYVDTRLPNLSQLAKPVVRHNVACSDTFGQLINEEAAAENGVKVPPCVK